MLLVGVGENLSIGVLDESLTRRQNPIILAFGACERELWGCFSFASDAFEFHIVVSCVLLRRQIARGRAEWGAWAQVVSCQLSEAGGGEERTRLAAAFSMGIL